MSVESDFGTRLSALLERRGAKLRLAKETGISSASITRYTSGRVPQADELLRIAKALNVTMEWLLEGRDPPCKLDPSELPQPRVIFSGSLDAQHGAGAAAERPAAYGVRTEDFRAVPLVEDAVAAGAARVVSDQIAGWAWVYAPLLGRRRNLVAVRVKGNSMDPVLPDGSVAVVDRDDRRVVPRGLYVVRLDGGCTVKYVAREGTGLVLIPENHAEYRETRIPAREGEADPIVGRVCWSWRVWT